MFRGLLLATALILGVQAYWKPKAKTKSKWYLIETEGETSCENDDSIRDKYRLTCSDGYDEHPEYCGRHDNWLFKASVLCCACGGGIKSSASPQSTWSREATTTKPPRYTTKWATRPRQPHYTYPPHLPTTTEPPPTNWATKCEYEDVKPTKYCLKYKKHCNDVDALPKVCAKTCKC